VKIVTKKPTPALADATVAALQQWRLKPAMKNGAPQEKQVTRSFFFTPPDGLPLQLGLNRVQYALVHDDRGTASIASGADWLLSNAMFEDFVLTGEVRVPEASAASLIIRAWAAAGQPKNSDDEAYRITLADRRLPPGSVTGQALTATTKTYDAGAAEAYRQVMSSWQPLKVECLDRTLRVSLGGRLVSESELVDGAVGHIGIEVSKGLIQVRGLLVRRLDQYRESVPLGVLYPDAHLPDPVDIASGITEPTLQHGERPSYTRLAMSERTEGTVVMEAVVEADGSVGAVQVVQSLSEELDASSVRTVKRWRFGPAKLHGEPVRCLVDVQLSFRLK
jgi:TonB family protein